MLKSNVLKISMLMIVLAMNSNAVFACNGGAAAEDVEQTSEAQPDTTEGKDS